MVATSQIITRPGVTVLSPLCRSRLCECTRVLGVGGLGLLCGSGPVLLLNCRAPGFGNLKTVQEAQLHGSRQSWPRASPGLAVWEEALVMVRGTEVYSGTRLGLEAQSGKKESRCCP